MGYTGMPDFDVVVKLGLAEEDVMAPLTGVLLSTMPLFDMVPQRGVIPEGCVTLTTGIKRFTGMNCNMVAQFSRTCENLMTKLALIIWSRFFHFRVDMDAVDVASEFMFLPKFAITVVALAWFW